MEEILGIEGARECGNLEFGHLRAQTGVTKNMPPPAFKYEALEPETIRLLKWRVGSTADDLRFELVTSRYLPDVQKYDEPYNALSYCWGDAAADLRRITIDKQPLIITKNLHSALLSIIFPQELEMRWPGLLWVDAICIDQQDIEERNSQVQQMWRIFNNASTVIAWLGDSNEQIDAAYHQCISQWAYPPHLQPSMKPAIRDILARQYFSRAWIVPEITQAGRVAFKCGTRAQWSHQVLASLVDQLANKECLCANEVRVATFIRSARLENGIEQGDNDAGSIFDRVFQAFFEAGCTDRRDRIFAMLQDPRIRSLSIALKPDYSMSENDLWLAVMKQHFSFRNCHSWNMHAERTWEFEKVLSKALAVDHMTEEFGRWLEPQIDSTFKVGDAKAIWIAALKVGGIVLLPQAVNRSTTVAADH